MVCSVEQHRQRFFVGVQKSFQRATALCAFSSSVIHRTPKRGQHFWIATHLRHKLSHHRRIAQRCSHGLAWIGIRTCCFIEHVVQFRIHGIDPALIKLTKTGHVVLRHLNFIVQHGSEFRRQAVNNVFVFGQNAANHFGIN